MRKLRLTFCLPFYLIMGFFTHVYSSDYQRDLVNAAFAADAFCLGPHWVYDTDELARLYPEGIADLDEPRSEYHPGKVKGDFTHYGDQTLVLLESLASRGEWSQEAWLEDWAEFWKSDPVSYLDGATRDAFDNYTSGSPRPSDSHDLAGASRMAPLLAFLSEEPLEVQIRSARQQVESTHGDPHVSDAAEFFVRVVNAVRKGARYSEAFDSAAVEGEYESSIGEELNAAREMLEGEPISIAQHFGQSCSVVKALPLTLWLALKYESDPVEMLEQNALVGGDSSARGMLLALLVAAKGEFSRLPESWTADQTARERIDTALDKLFP
ncbi:ADP-ribosylglycohydrolase family protein [Pelagicoccus albus]|uniref:ADP-ribosylglycohydrolase family protein n=1 Tax=Pelagicoccus albus TaxID=415222 RepID=A0A7X1E798_9BACT|nr:ADP-ribosylglycohydrolase family protein [Pelagicoccus albus]MBC2604956.1 ADP-ribosylglycohydrolase family protein [Pelagicoccus albus]